MRLNTFVGLALALVAFVVPSALEAQAGAAPTRPRVFFDCQGPQCDQTHYRTEIGWVDWVRDRNDSHVHIIMTSQATGAGGRQYQLDYIGVGPYASYSAQSRYQSLPTDTQVMQLDGVARTLALGIAQFANSNNFGALVNVTPIGGAGGGAAAGGFGGAGGPGAGGVQDGLVAASEVEDPWNLWVFRMMGNGNFSGEETRKNYSGSLGFNASRTTPTWKTSHSGNFSYNRQEITRTNGTLFVDERQDWSLNQTLVYSIADHWSVGIRGGAARMTRQNQKLRIQANPAIEYSVFPYDEATRRSLTVFWEIGPVLRDYINETIYGETKQLLAEQALTISYSARQPWGNASIDITESSYLHDLEFYNVSLRGSISYRITRGINLNLNGNMSWVKDQIYLSGAGLTEEQRLLRLQQEATSYTYGGSMGLSWQFGSIFNNVVNNRFPGGGGGGGPFGGGGGGN